MLDLESLDFTGFSLDLFLNIISTLNINIVNNTGHWSRIFDHLVFSLWEVLACLQWYSVCNSCRCGGQHGQDDAKGDSFPSEGFIVAFTCESLEESYSLKHTP